MDWKETIRRQTDDSGDRNRKNNPEMMRQRVSLSVGNIEIWRETCNQINGSDIT